MSLPDDTKDLMDKWLIPPIVAENEQLKARVIALEAALGEATGRIETDGKLIAELEGERDRLKVILEPFARSYDAIKRDNPEWLLMDFISDYFTPAELAATRSGE